MVITIKFDREVIKSFSLTSKNGKGSKMASFSNFFMIGHRLILLIRF